MWDGWVILSVRTCLAGTVFCLVQLQANHFFPMGSRNLRMEACPITQRSPNTGSSDPPDHFLQLSPMETSNI